MITEERFTGASFVILKKEDFQELGIGFAGRRLLGSLLDEIHQQPPAPTPPVIPPPTEVNPVAREFVLYHS